MKELKSLYKRSELTEDMFQKWIIDVRKEFKKAKVDIKTSMNLIAVGISILDDPSESIKLKARRRDRLWEFFENHLADSKRLLCDSCGSLMEVYYTVHCFKCEKPVPKDSELNYFLCVYWLEKNEKDFNKDKLWDYLLKHDTISGNDMYCKLPTITNDSNMQIFMKHFDTKTTKYFVSW